MAGLSAYTMISKTILKVKRLDSVFISELIFFSLIITGLLPRETAMFLAIGLAVYVAMASLEDATILFVRSIPLFLALPITETFDNFNTWRIISAIIFLKWAWPKVTNLATYQFNKKFRTHSILLAVLLLIAFLSVIPALDKIVAIKRIIYFINLNIHLNILLYFNP